MALGWLAVVLCSGLLVRLTLHTGVFPALHGASHTFATSTICDSREQLVEGAWLHEQGQWPYGTSVFCLPPALLPMGSLALHHPSAYAVLHAVLETLIALTLCAAANAVAVRSTRPGATVAALFFLNPVAVIGFPALSTNTLQHALIAVVVWGCTRRGQSALVGVCAAVAVYMNPALGVALPTLAWNCIRCGRHQLVLFAVFFAVATGAVWSYASEGVGGVGWQDVLLSYRRSLFMRMGAQPNWGLQWYFFREVFPSFAPMFHWMFLAMPLVLSGPIALKLADVDNAPLRVLQLQLCLTTVMKPYMTLSDMAFAISACAVSFHTVRTMPYGFLFCALVSVVVPAGHVFYYAWVVLGTANVNFFYFCTLGLGGAFILFTVQFLTRAIMEHREVNERPKQE